MIAFVRERQRIERHRTSHRDRSPRSRSIPPPKRVEVVLTPSAGACSVASWSSCGSPGARRAFPSRHSELRQSRMHDVHPTAGICTVTRRARERASHHHPSGTQPASAANSRFSLTRVRETDLLVVEDEGAVDRVAHGSASVGRVPVHHVLLTII